MEVPEITIWITTIVAPVYLRDLVKRHFKKNVLHIRPDAPTKEYDKWAWEFWR